MARVLAMTYFVVGVSHVKFTSLYGNQIGAGFTVVLRTVNSGLWVRSIWKK